MSNSEQVQLIPDEITVIDWYDGVIRGIARSQDHYCLFILAAWNPDSRRRAYVVVNLDRATADEMIKLWKLAREDESDDEEKWSRFNQLYDQYLTYYQDVAYVLGEEPLVAKSSTMTRIAPDDIADLRGFDIEKTIDLKAHKLWFGME